jgi:hypothetical protein
MKTTLARSCCFVRKCSTISFAALRISRRSRISFPSCPNFSCANTLPPLRRRLAPPRAFTATGCPAAIACRAMATALSSSSISLPCAVTSQKSAATSHVRAAAGRSSRTAAAGWRNGVIAADVVAAAVTGGRAQIVATIPSAASDGGSYNAKLSPSLSTPLV